MIVNGTKGPVRNRSCPHAYRNTESAFISSLAVRPFHVANDAPADRHGLSNPEQRVAPEAILLDQALLDRPQIKALVTRLESLM